MNAHTLKSLGLKATDYADGYPPITAIRRTDLRQLLAERAELLSALKESERVMFGNIGPDMPEQSKAILRAREAIANAEPNPNAGTVQAHPDGRWTGWAQ